jgi:hypothetical protein
MYDEERREVQELSLTFPRLSKKGYNSMALLMPHTPNQLHSLHAGAGRSFHH